MAILAILLALGASAVMASPAPIETLTPAAAGDFATAIGGALDPAVTPAGAVNGAMMATPPEYLTIQITNSFGMAVSTSHANNANAPTPVGGTPAAGNVANGAVVSFAAPTNWAGNIAIVQGGFAITGDDSLIEANFVEDTALGIAVADVDVSYVNGFSVPIICKCSGVQVTGCNDNLWNMNTCPNNDDEGACINPLRSSNSATSATTFFAPCQGKAYTFPNDSAANSWGACQSGLIQCCVGWQCT